MYFPLTFYMQLPLYFTKTLHHGIYQRHNLNNTNKKPNHFARQMGSLNTSYIFLGTMKTKWSSERERVLLKVTQVRFRPVILARTTEPVSQSPHRPHVFSVTAQVCFIFPALKQDNTNNCKRYAWETTAHSESQSFPFLSQLYENTHWIKCLAFHSKTRNILVQENEDFLLISMSRLE